MSDPTTPLRPAHLTPEALQALWPQIMEPFPDYAHESPASPFDSLPPGDIEETLHPIRAQFLYDRITHVLGPGHLRLMDPRFEVERTAEGVNARCYVTVAIGNWNEDGTWHTLADAFRVGGGLHSRRDYAEKMALTNAVKLALGSLGIGHEVYLRVDATTLAQLAAERLEPGTYSITLSSGQYTLDPKTQQRMFEGTAVLAATMDQASLAFAVRATDDAAQTLNLALQSHTPLQITGAPSRTTPGRWLVATVAMADPPPPALQVEAPGPTPTQEPAEPEGTSESATPLPSDPSTAPSPEFSTPPSPSEEVSPSAPPPYVPTPAVTEGLAQAEALYEAAKPPRIPLATLQAAVVHRFPQAQFHPHHFNTIAEAQWYYQLLVVLALPARNPEPDKVLAKLLYQAKKLDVTPETLARWATLPPEDAQTIPTIQRELLTELLALPVPA